MPAWDISTLSLSTPSDKRAPPGHPQGHSVPAGVTGGFLLPPCWWQVLPHTLQEVPAGQPVSPGRITQHQGLPRGDVTAWGLQPSLHLLQLRLQPLSLRARRGAR